MHSSKQVSHESKCDALISLKEAIALWGGQSWMPSLTTAKNDFYSNLSDKIICLY